MRQVVLGLLGLGLGFIESQGAIAEVPSAHSSAPPAAAEQLDLDPATIESPVLQRWLQEVPDVRLDIRDDPSFRTRLRLGYTRLGEEDGLNIGIEDIFIGRSPLTASADYQTAATQTAYGAELRYYILPLGSSVNVAPVVGYRHVEENRDITSGANVGLRILLSLSRTGAADASLSQTFVAPGTNQEIGITTLSLGYALTDHLRLSTDLQRQNAPYSKDNRIGVSLEWML